MRRAGSDTQREEEPRSQRRGGAEGGRRAATPPGTPHDHQAPPPHDPRERVCALCGFSRRAHRACSSPSEQTSPSACAHAPLSRGPTTFPCYHLVEAREILTVQLCVNELTRDLSSDDLCMCVCDVCMCDGDVDRPRRGRGRFLTIPIYKCHWVDVTRALSDTRI